MIMWRAFLGRIEQRTVDRESGKSVWINGYRLPKVTNSFGYFHTWKEAHDFAIADAKNEIEIGKRRLANAQAHLLERQKDLARLEQTEEPK